MVPLLLVALLLTAGFLVGGCGMRDQYKSEWVNTMSEFESQVSKDDTKANDLTRQNDISGLIDLLTQRSKFVDQTYDRIVVLRPSTPDQKDLHAATLFYLTSVKDQLKTNKDYYEALREGKPTNDLKTIAEDAAKQTQSMRVILGLDMDKTGAKIKEIKPKESNPKSSVPSSIPQ